LTALEAEDCIVESPTAGGIVKGRDAIAVVHRAWFNAFPDTVMTGEQLLIDGDRAAWIVVAQGTDTGGFLGMPATGKPFRLPMVFLCDLKDNRIVHERRIYDFTGMLVQIGVLKAKAPTSSISRAASLTSLNDPAESGPPAGDAGRPMSRDAIAALLAQRHDAWRRRDIDVIVGQHADDCVMVSHLAGTVTGRDAIRRVYETWFTSFPDSGFTSEWTVIDGDHVADIGSQSGTDAGGFMGLVPTGKPFRVPAVWLFELKNGSFTHVRPIYDFTGLLVQIGVLKAKPA
jgi:steroid delta-isomerase-like uncharacterized protein